MCKVLTFGISAYLKYVILQNHVWIKDTIRAQDELMNFNVTEYENVITMVSDSISLRNCHLVQSGVVSKKNIHY